MGPKRAGTARGGSGRASEDGALGRGLLQWRWRHGRALVREGYDSTWMLFCWMKQNETGHVSHERKHIFRHVGFSFFGGFWWPLGWIYFVWTTAYLSRGWIYLAFGREVLHSVEWSVRIRTRRMNRCLSRSRSWRITCALATLAKHHSTWGKKLLSLLLRNDLIVLVWALKPGDWVGLPVFSRVAGFEEDWWLCQYHHGLRGIAQDVREASKPGRAPETG